MSALGTRVLADVRVWMKSLTGFTVLKSGCSLVRIGENRDFASFVELRSNRSYKTSFDELCGLSLAKTFSNFAKGIWFSKDFEAGC